MKAAAVWHIDSFTDFDDVLIEAGGKVFRFEFSRRFGPMMLGKRGELIQTMPPLRSPFWKAMQAWADQGCRIVDGLAVYELPVEPVYVRLVGRHHVEVPPGRDPKDVRREWFEKVGLPVPEDADQ